MVSVSVFSSLSVLGGWQTIITETGYRFGPVFNSVTDLWKWQRDNLPSRAFYAQID